MKKKEICTSKKFVKMLWLMKISAYVIYKWSLREAFSLVGFVYIRDHGIKDDLIKSAMEASKEYFLMPTEVKEAFPRDPAIQQGYVRYNEGTPPRPSEITGKKLEHKGDGILLPKLF